MTSQQHRDYGTHNNQDAGYRKMSSFSSEEGVNEVWENEDRLGFIRKVYGILSAQLLFTAFLCVLPYLSESFRLFMIQYWWIALLLGIGGIVLSCCLFCIPSMARTVPTNYYLMFAFTFCEGYIVAFCCAVTNDHLTVLSAAFFTAAIVIGLTIYAMTTKTDFTVCGGFLFMFGAVFVMFGIFSIFFGPTLRMIYCIIGVLLFGIYLIVDT